MAETTRTLDDALANAAKIAHELPQLIQPGPTDYDMITLANEVYRLRAELDQRRVKGERNGQV